VLATRPANQSGDGLVREEPDQDRPRGGISHGHREQGAAGGRSCDDFEAKLRRTDETARKLADALVAELLA